MKRRLSRVIGLTISEPRAKKNFNVFLREYWTDDLELSLANKWISHPAKERADYIMQ